MDQPVIDEVPRIDVVPGQIPGTIVVRTTGPVMLDLDTFLLSLRKLRNQMRNRHKTSKHAGKRRGIPKYAREKNETREEA